MKAVESELAEIKFRSLTLDKRWQIRDSISLIEKWDTDPFVRSIAQLLPGHTNVYAIQNTRNGLYVVFRVDPDAIKILDIAYEDGIRVFVPQFSGNGV